MPRFPVKHVKKKDEFEKEIKSEWADLANIAKPNVQAGSVMGGIFLKEFVGETPWVHLDIAPRMTAIEGEYLTKGAAGVPVMLLARFLEETSA